MNADTLGLLAFNLLLETWNELGTKGLLSPTETREIMDRTLLGLETAQHPALDQALLAQARALLERMLDTQPPAY